MPHLQVSDQTASKAHAAALQRRSTPTPAQYRSELQAAHAAAIARANRVCSRERGVISIYALGEVIARIEDEQLLAGANLNIEASVALHSAIIQLKALLPI